MAPVRIRAWLKRGFLTGSTAILAGLSARPPARRPTLDSRDRPTAGRHVLQVRAVMRFFEAMGRVLPPNGITTERHISGYRWALDPKPYVGRPSSDVIESDSYWSAASSNLYFTPLLSRDFMLETR